MPESPQYRRQHLFDFPPEELEAPVPGEGGPSPSSLELSDDASRSGIQQPGVQSTPADEQRRSASREGLFGVPAPFRLPPSTLRKTGNGFHPGFRLPPAKKSRDERTLFDFRPSEPIIGEPENAPPESVLPPLVPIEPAATPAVHPHDFLPTRREHGPKHLPFAVASGERAKARDILAAIRTLKDVERERRAATVEEQHKLVRFAGFGPVALSIFPDPVTGRYKDASWQAIGEELRSLLTPDEFDSAKRTVFNAFYTSPTVIAAMHAAMQRLGLPEDASILEPGCGTGNFMTAGRPGLRFIGIEMDSISGRIAKALHPDQDIRIENFRDTRIAESSLDGVMTELPMVLVDVQRGGPSTGLPTKTEQADLMLAMYGRNSDSPMPIVAAASPGDCFYMAQEAVRIAVEFMTPCLLLTDGYLANGAEPWRIPVMADLKPIVIKHPEGKTKAEANGSANGHSHNGESNGDDNGFMPYARDSRLVRPWAIPGTPGLEHRLGGIEKKDGTGNIEYSPANHQHMTETRRKKIANIADAIPLQEVEGPKSGKVLVLSWGGTYGAVLAAVQSCIAKGQAVAHAHLRYLNPFPKNLGDIIKNYEKVLIPELNDGQLLILIRSKYLVDAKGFNKVQGKPFLVRELVDRINQMLETR